MKLKLIGVGLVAVLLLLGYFYFAPGAGLGDGAGTYSHGYRSGFIFKFSEKGSVYKGWEGSMLLGPSPQGFFPVASTKDGGQGVETIFHFSLVDSQETAKLKDLILDAQRHRRYVTLEYDQKRFKGVGTDTPYIIVNVQPESN